MQGGGINNNGDNNNKNKKMPFSLLAARRENVASTQQCNATSSCKFLVCLASSVGPTSTS